MFKKSKKIIIILATCCSSLAFAQIAPVGSRTIAVPPYSARLSEWSEQLSLSLLLRDLSVVNGEVFVRMHIEGSSILLETNVLHPMKSFRLEGGVPLHISGSELSSLFSLENLDFSGISRENFVQNGGRLPEGRYKVWFSVYEWTTKRRVSASESPAVITLHDVEPPTLTSPQNNSLIIAESPQNVVFTWMPKHQSAIGNGFHSVYDFELIHIPKSYNGDLKILFETSQKYAEKELFTTQFRYGSFDEELIANERYAFRVRVRSADDNAAFQIKNDGYSEIFTFQYAEKCETPKNLQGFAEDAYRANLSWTADDFQNQYLVSYRKADDDANAWFTRHTSDLEVQLNDLSPAQTFEVKIKTICEFTQSAESKSIMITTPSLAIDTIQECGKTFAPSENCVKPLKTLTKKDVFKSGGTTIHITEISGNDGIFTGKGYITMPILNMMRLNVTFQNIRINECFEHTEGVISAVSEGKKTKK